MQLINYREIEGVLLLVECHRYLDIAIYKISIYQLGFYHMLEFFYFEDCICIQSDAYVSKFYLGCKCKKQLHKIIKQKCSL
jgi:hypothetical protein